MYNTIINPKTNRLVNINSKLGKSIVINYFNKINGGAKNKEFCEINEKTNRCKGTNTDPNDGKCLKNPKTARCKMTNNYKNSERPRSSRKKTIKPIKTIKTHKINTFWLDFDFNDVPDLLENPPRPAVWDDPTREDWTWGDEDHPEEWEEKENYWKEVQRINVHNRKMEKEHWKKVLEKLGEFKEGDIIEDTWPDRLGHPTEKYIIEKENGEFVVNIYWD